MMRLLAFLSVCAAGLELSAQSVRNREIYDFGVGDVFHYMITNTSFGPSYPPSYTKTEIKAKYLSADSNTVYYVATRSSSSLPSVPGNWVTTTTEDTTQYDNLDSLVKSIDTVYSDPDKYNGRMIYLDRVNDLQHYEETEFIVGCGTTHYEEDSGVEWRVRLVYFKKGSEEWGTPVTVGIENIPERGGVRIYPNPTKGLLTIELPDPEQYGPEVFLTDLSGKTIYRAGDGRMFNRDRVVLDLSRFSPGIYLLVLHSGNRQMVHRIAIM